MCKTLLRETPPRTVCDPKGMRSHETTHVGRGAPIVTEKEPATFTGTEVPQNSSVMSMSEMAMATVLVRMARPVARPTPSGPPDAVIPVCSRTRLPRVLPARESQASAITSLSSLLRWRCVAERLDVLPACGAGQRERTGARRATSPTLKERQPRDLRRDYTTETSAR